MTCHAPEHDGKAIHDALAQDVQDKAVGGQPRLEVDHVFGNTLQFAAAPSRSDALAILWVDGDLTGQSAQALPTAGSETIPAPP